MQQNNAQNSAKFAPSLIMLVDDNPVNREIGSEILRTQGLVVDCFENGQLAVDAVTQKNYHAILMDIQMPVMDGLTAAAHIRALGGKYKSLPIIAMTAHARKEDIEKMVADAERFKDDDIKSAANGGKVVSDKGPQTYNCLSS